MPKNDADRVPSGEKDVEVLKNLIAADKLDTVLSKLDPNHVGRTLKRVPAGVVRLLLVIFGDPHPETQIATLRPDQREPVQQLLDAAKRHRGQEFRDAFVAAAKDDDRILRRVGFSTTDMMPIPSTEAKSFNTVTKVIACPMVMLKSSRLYSEIALFQVDSQGERLLFRSTMELDEIVMVAERLLSAAVKTTQLLRDRTPALRPNVAVRRCTDLTKSIRGHLSKLSIGLAKIQKFASKRNGRTTRKRQSAQKTGRDSI